MKFVQRAFCVMMTIGVLVACGGGNGGPALPVAEPFGVGESSNIQGTPGSDGARGSQEIAGESRPANIEDPDGVGFDVFLLAGGANMVGYNDSVDSALDASDPRIFQLGLAGAHKNEIIPALDPLEHPDKNRGVGLAMRFAKAYLDSRPVGHRILLVPAAIGNASFSGGGWNPGDGGFEEAVTRANLAMAKNANNRFAGILWHQGETDVQTWGSTPEIYRRALDQAIYSFRAKISGAASAPVVLGKFTDGWAGGDADSSREKKAAIMAAIDDTPSRVPFVAVADAASLAYVPADPVHFSAAGQREYGARYFAQFLNAQRSHLAMFTLPSAPFDLASSSGATWIKLNWTAPGESGSYKVTGYRVGYRPSGTAGWTEHYVDGSEASAFLVGLVPASSYVVRVVAVGQAGLSDAALLDSVATLPLSAVVLPQADFEYAFEDQSLVNTGSLGTAMNGIAAGTGVSFVADAQRGNVLRLSQGTGIKGWVTVPRAINPTAYTKALWVKFASYGSNQNLISSDNGELAGRHEAFFSDVVAILNGEPAHFGDDNQARAAPGAHTFLMKLDQAISAGGHGGALDRVEDPAGAPALETWYHFAVTYDSVSSGGVLRLYRDGMRVAERKGVPRLINRANDFTVGALADADALNGGLLDNVRVYDRSLDDGAISDMYSKELAR